ncbi:MAG: diaminopropionate ammonia-lyase, partial [Clostridiales bacterium]|nr:diaminopropionate ammonia-lyase [Clostridiales bacterium]
MKHDLKLHQLHRESPGNYDISFLDVKTARDIAAFHKSFPMYKATPFQPLSALAHQLGVKDILVKDESHRFGLNAFKVLGGSYAIGRVVADQLGEDLTRLPFERLVSDEIRDKLGSVTFVTATDGNHGRGVAWTANQLKQHSIVLMPRGAAEERVANIAAEGAKVSVEDCNYDEAVRMADDLAQKNGYVMVQDTAWEGYEDIPRWIMQGYMTMALEMENSLKAMKKKPTHLFVQAGVGSLAAAVTGFFANAYPGEDKPIITVVEPNVVDCIYRSAVANQRVLIGGEYFTIMAGLACGEPNTVGLKVLMDYADNFISAPDELAAYGMRVLGSPLPSDPQIISGESGAA